MVSGRSVTPRRRRSWTSASTSRDTPPASPANTGPSLVGAGRLLRVREQRAAGARPLEEPRRHRLERQLAGPARVDAAQQRLQQPIGDLGAELLVDDLADRDVAVNAGQLRRGSSAARAKPASVSTPASAEASVGTPSRVGGTRTGRPPISSRGFASVGWTTITPKPSSWTRSTASGRRARNRLGAPVQPDAVERHRRELAAAPRCGFDQRDPSDRREPPCRDQAGDPATDDDHVAAVRRAPAARPPNRPAGLISAGRRSRPRSRGTLAVDEVDDPGEHVRIGVRRDAVAEVEHVARRLGAGADHLTDPLGQHRPGRGEQGGVEIALHGVRRPDPATSPPPAAAASPPRPRPRRPRPSARAARRCRRRSGSAARPTAGPGPARPRECGWT